MNDILLKSRLRQVARRYQWLGLWRKLAAGWAVATLLGVGLVWLQRATGWSSPLTLPLFAAFTGAMVTALAMLHFVQGPDDRWVARKIEDRHPELDGLLLTAVQQREEAGGRAGYFQTRVLQEATARSQEHDWRQVIPRSRLLAVHGVHLVAVACLAMVLLELRFEPRPPGEKSQWTGADGITVTPGDASIEKGETFVVLARFGGALPAAVSMVVSESGAAPRAIPLVKSLADPVYGGSVAEVTGDFTYRLEYRGRQTKEFKVAVFEHPRLVRSDVELTFPEYTKLPARRIEDTRRVSAVEGTRLDFALQLNKPVASARLVARDEEKTVIPLEIAAGAAVATLPAFMPEQSRTYDLQLVDADGRANKVAAPFVIDVLPNRPPEVRMVTPRGDVRPSALEEIAFTGSAWDDFGMPRYGLDYSIAGAEPVSIEFGRDAAAKQKRTFEHLLALEDLGAKPDDLISWFVWAEDIGPDGQVRRTSGDLYFAEVRPFDEIFRESQEMDSGEQQESQGGERNQARRLTELQKQIINATWNLQREGATPQYAEDAKVVKESQEQALAQAVEEGEGARSPPQQALWKTATQEMEKAIEKLAAAANDPGRMAQALPAEQAAYQALLRLQARETNVTRGGRGGGGGGGQQANQRQIDQLDLKQAENRYETQRQAQAPQSRERAEELAVTNRLQELARRQQDINERLKELQTALQEAKSEQEREEVRRRLKRLQEEQRQMLAEVDEVRQRMDRPENQSRMAEERQRLEQTREDLQNAAEAAAEGSVAQALASGTRAQRQLQEMRDTMRKESSSQFAEDLREMRQEARELSRQQEEISRQLDALNNAETKRRSLSETGERQEAMEQLAGQKERMNELVDRAREVSEQAENIEPLLSRQLYDSVRKLTQDDANTLKQGRQELLNSGMMTRDMYQRLQRAAENEQGGKAFDLATELLREGLLPQASQAGNRVRSEVDEFRRGVERAAESVLGDDAEQLRLAQSELDALTEQLLREIAQGQGRERGGAEGAGQPGQPGGEGRQAGADGGQDPSQRRAGAAGEEPGQPGQPGQEGSPGQGNQAGREGQLAGTGGQQPGEPGGQGQSEASAGAEGSPGQPGGGGQQAAQGGRGELAEGRGGRDQRGGGRGGLTLENLLGGGSLAEGDGRGAWLGNAWSGGPLTGEDFGQWTERLRDVEELLDTPELRSAVAAARERARLLRRDIRQDSKKPDWAVVELEVVRPLVEVRARVAEELARLGPKESLAPIDRDPVPNRFTEAVRRYYEALGKDQ